MSLKALAASLQATGLSPVEKLALIFLADSYTDDAGVGRLPLVDPAKVIGDFLGTPPLEASTVVKALFEKRILRRVPAPMDLLFEGEDASGVWFHMDVTQAWEVQGAAKP